MKPTIKQRPFSAKPTLAAVAEAAGVSSATVSRILNNSGKVSSQTRRTVLDTIERLRYRPNALARGLAKGKTNSIGVITQDLASPYYGETLRGVESALGGSGLVPLFASGHWRLADEVERIEHLLSRRVDGLIILDGKLTDDQLRRYARLIPVVITGRALNAPQLASLSVDNFLGARMATRHLINSGHTRIAHIAGPRDHASTHERVAGYKAALEEAGLMFDAELVTHADFHEPGGVIAVNQLLASRSSFSALFAANDQTAFGAQLALSRHGIRVPDDISIVGFDDLPVSSYMIPPLTTIRLPIYETGLKAARLLMAMLGGGQTDESLPKPELMIRASTRVLRR